MARKYTTDGKTGTNLFDFLTGRVDASGRIGTSEWFALCRDLKCHGVLGPYAQSVENSAPRPVARKVAAWLEDHKRATEARVKLLSEFSELAHRESLHAVLIKGIGLSQVAFDDPLLRQSGDMDLLVDCDDIPKADWILRSLGWRQPGEARLVRPLHNENSLTEEVLDALESPYPLRSNRILPHVTNYYKKSNYGFETIELHDRFHGIDTEKARMLLWARGMAHVHDCNLLTPGLAASLILSGLSLHEDAETVRANTSESGTMGVKACIDIHGMLDKMDRSALLEARELAELLDVKTELSSAFSDVIELFGEDAPKLQSIIAGELASPWTVSYLDRVRDPEKRAVLGMADARAVLAGATPKETYGTWAALKSGDYPPIDTVFEAKATRHQASTKIEWMLPAHMKQLTDNLVLQAIGLLDHDSRILGFRANVFLSGGNWTGCLQEMGRNAIDGHANKINKGKPVDVTWRINSSGEIIVSASIPKVDEILPSVWHKIYGQLHSHIAGPNFTELIESTLAAPS